MAQPTKVFVGSLPPGTKPEELRRLFENYGIVVECDVMNRCGFVHMKNPAMAENAIVALNASEFKGQPIVVEHGRPKERKQIGGGGAVGRGGNEGGQRTGRGGPVGGSMIVGFPGRQSANTFNQAATLQLAGIVMELLGDQQNQIDEISGGQNNMRGGVGGGGQGGNDHGFRRSGGQGGNDHSFRRSGGRDNGPQGGGGRGGNFQGGNRGGNQNMNGLGPMRNTGFKHDRQTPYSQGMNMGGPANMRQSGPAGGGGRFNNQANNHQGGGGGMGGRSASGPSGNFNNPRSGGNNYGGGSNSWNNDQRGGGMPPQQGGRNFTDDKFTGGFSGNMGNSSGNYGSQQDRRGFALPSNQFQQYGGSGNQGGGFGNDDGGVPPYNDDNMYPRRNNQPNMAGGSNFNRGGNQGGRGQIHHGGYQNNRGGQPGGQPQQQTPGFKRGGPVGNNAMNSGDNYQQNFPPLGGGNQGGYGNNRFQGGQGGRSGGSGGVGGGGMHRNAPRQNMPNRRY